MMTEPFTPSGPLSRRVAIAGIGETDYVRRADESILQMILGASMGAIRNAGLTPDDVDGIIPPSRFVAWDEIAAHLGIKDVRYTSTPRWAEPARRPHS